MINNEIYHVAVGHVIKNKQIKCCECGKRVMVTQEHRYKINGHYFCTYTCMRKAEKRFDERRLYGSTHRGTPTKYKPWMENMNTAQARLTHCREKYALAIAQKRERRIIDYWEYMTREVESWIKINSEVLDERSVSLSEVCAAAE